MARLVREVMTAKPRTIRVQDRLTKAAKAMRSGDVGAVLVREDDQLRGVLTDRDIVVRAIAEGRDPAEVQAGDICSRDIATVTPDDDIARAVSIMRERHVRRLAVVQDGRPVGVVSLGDLAIERDPHSVLGEISAAPGSR